MLCRMQLNKTNLLAWLKICLESQKQHTADLSKYVKTIRCMRYKFSYRDIQVKQIQLKT